MKSRTKIKLMKTYDQKARISVGWGRTKFSPPEGMPNLSEKTNKKQNKKTKTKQTPPKKTTEMCTVKYKK